MRVYPVKHIIMIITRILKKRKNPSFSHFLLIITQSTNQPCGINDNKKLKVNVNLMKFVKYINVKRMSFK